MKFIALFLSGGVGSRVGGEIPKQYLSVNGRPVFSYSLKVLMEHKDIFGVQIVADPEWESEIALAVKKDGMDTGRLLGFSIPGATRQLSVLNGLKDILLLSEDPSETYIIIHDAARPMLGEKLISDIVDACPGHDGALPVLPMRDTIYESKDGRIISGLLDRSTLFAGQAPEAYVLDKYIKANEALLPKDILAVNGACEPAVSYGMDIALIAGDENNFKITTKSDMERFANSL